MIEEENGASLFREHRKGTHQEVRMLTIPLRWDDSENQNEVGIKLDMTPGSSKVLV